jgi:hypothetical protein
VQFQEDKLVHEHIYWDQASVLVQLGLLDPDGLPIWGRDRAQSARRFPAQQHTDDSVAVGRLAHGYHLAVTKPAIANIGTATATWRQPLSSRAILLGPRRWRDRDRPGGIPTLSQNRPHTRVSKVSRGLLRGRGRGVTSCAGVRRGPAFWGCDVSLNRCRGVNPSVGERCGWHAGVAGRP